MGSQTHHGSSSSGYMSINPTDKPCSRTFTRASSPPGSKGSLTARHEQEGTHRVGKEKFQFRRGATYDSKTRVKSRSGRNSPVREVQHCYRPDTPIPTDLEPEEKDEEEFVFNRYIRSMRIPINVNDTRPPISANTLAELECRQITSNPRLRHDVNFDRELHFRPNTDGTRGQEKLALAQKFWVAVELELQSYGFLLSDANGEKFRWTPRWTAEFKKRSLRIPQVFKTVKEILISLLPEQDQPRVEEMLDIPLIMQQIERGTFDMTSFFVTLAKLLKVHCAPMRDNWLDKMVALVTEDPAAFSPTVIVSALKELFGILEAMKLDIANHHIRYLRPSLLESTIGFEQAYYTQKMSRGHIDSKVALSWLHHPLGNSSSSETGDLNTFLNAFVSSMFPFSNVHRPFPPTFKLDHNRLYALCSDICNSLCTDICCQALELLMTNYGRPTSEISAALTAFPTLLQTIVGVRANEAQWASELPNIAAELVRLAFKDFTPSAGQSLPSMVALCDEIEVYLNLHTVPQSDIFSEKAIKMHAEILLRVKEAVWAHISMSPSVMFENLVAAPARAAATTANIKYYASSAPKSGDALRKGSGNARTDDFVRRAAHIAVLHWRVWAPLLYARQPDEPEEDVDLLPTPPTSPSMSLA